MDSIWRKFDIILIERQDCERFENFVININKYRFKTRFRMNI